MKSAIIKNWKRWMLALCLCVGSTITVQASTLITFSVDMSIQVANNTFTNGVDIVQAQGTFNNWASFLPLVEVGSSSVYTNTFNDTLEANGTSTKFQYLYTVGGNNTFEVSADFDLRAAFLPVTSGASLILPTPDFNDAGPAITQNITFQVDMAQQVALGNFIPGTSTIQPNGSLNAWGGTVDLLTNDPSILRTNQFGLVSSNVYVGTFAVTASPNAAVDYKYVINGSAYESVLGTNANNAGNRFFTLINSSQVLPAFFYSDAPFGPACKVKLKVDMSVLQNYDPNFNPTTVTLDGDFNGWSTPLPCTNNPTGGNTNIYAAVITVGQGTTVNYQFRYNNFDGNTGYDNFPGNGNRTFFVPAGATSTNLPTAIFNFVQTNDVVPTTVNALFSVDMTGAIGNDTHPFDPTADDVYINGQFVDLAGDYGDWYAFSGANPASAPPGYQMIRQGVSMIYTNTIAIPAGTPVAFNYLYGMDIGRLNGGPSADETTTNHIRVIRSTAINPYPLPVDTFGVPYREPLFGPTTSFGNYNTPTTLAGGNLSVGAMSGGSVPVTWLGRPGARLQVNTNLTSGSGWQTVVATDGNNWSAGTFNSTNGFTSQTNWPSSGTTFFRLVKP